MRFQLNDWMDLRCWVMQFFVLTICGSISDLRANDAKEGRPNFLFVLVDDQSPFDLKIYNPSSSLDSPVLDSLAEQGMVIDGAHHMGAWVGGVCTPSRHMIMSGRSVWHIPNY